MILNPWKMNWESPEEKKDSLFRCCQFSKLYLLPCKYARSPKAKANEECKTCFFKQQAMSTAWSINKGVKRVCDRCGAEILDPDKMIYAIARDRKGEYLADMELCRSCSQEYIDWIEGKDFPISQMFDDFIGDSELPDWEE